VGKGALLRAVPTNKVCIGLEEFGGGSAGCAALGQPDRANQQKGRDMPGLLSACLFGISP